MIFLELVLQNFGPYHGRQTINLSPENNGIVQPIILFGGMNGGGKTNLMDAIRLAFYGQRAQCSTRGNLSYGDFLNQCINRHAKPTEETVIELAFEHVLNNLQVVFRVQRSWTRNIKNGKDNLSVSVDKWLDDALTKTWDERIEDILPLGISNLFLFDGEQVKELAELETPPPQVIEAIQSLLGLELAKRLSVDLDILVNRKRKEIASAKDLANLEDIEAKLSELHSKQEVVKQDNASWQKKLEVAQQNYQVASEKFISEGGKIAAEHSELKNQLESLENTVDKQRQELRDLAAGNLPLALIQSLLEEVKLQGDKELKYQEAKIANNVLQARDKRLLDYAENLSLDSNSLDKIKLFLEQENKVLEQEIEAGTQSWLNADSEVVNQVKNLTNHLLPNQRKMAQDKRGKLQQLEADYDSTERQLQTAASPEAFQRLKDDLKQAQENLIQTQARYEEGRRKSEILAVAIKQAKQDLQQYGKQNIDTKSDEHIITAAAKVQQTLSLFRERLTLKKLNKLEIEVSECFRYLLHKSDLVHRIAIDSDNFRLSLYDITGQIVPKHRLSAGEKQLLAIAFLWGLARVSGRQLPVAIDTPLGRLDSFHRVNLVERYFPSASHQVILLSTDTEIGRTEVKMLREQEAIAREYLLKYDSAKQETAINSGYFW